MLISNDPPQVVRKFINDDFTVTITLQKKQLVTGTFEMKNIFPETFHFTGFYAEEEPDTIQVSCIAESYNNLGNPTAILGFSGKIHQGYLDITHFTQNLADGISSFGRSAILYCNEMQITQQRSWSGTPITSSYN